MGNHRTEKRRGGASASKARSSGIAVLLILGCLLVTAGPLQAAPVAPDEVRDRTEEAPAQLRHVDIKEHLGDALPLDLPFRDETGKEVRLKDYFTGELPVILTFNYSNCPMLCSLQLNGLVDTLKRLQETPGRQFRILTISIDPKEAPERARETLDKYQAQYARPEAVGGWHVLTGSEESITAAARAVGVSYTYDAKRKEYAHPPVLAIATPGGKLARYLYGIDYDPRTLQLSLVEASEGRIGTTVDRFLLYCFHYDANEGRYAPLARRIMSLGGAVAVLALGTLLFFLWRAELAKNRRTPRPDGARIGAPTAESRT